MAKGDPEDLAAQAAKRAEFRLHHVGTKLNERELRELEELLAKRGQPVEYIEVRRRASSSVGSYWRRSGATGAA